MGTDTKKLEIALEEKDYETVKSEIEKLVEKKLTDEELGEGLTGLASVYLDLSSSVSEKYMEALKQAIEGMKKINHAEKEVVKGANINDLKAKIQKSMQ